MLVPNQDPRAFIFRQNGRVEAVWDRHTMSPHRVALAEQQPELDRS